MGLESPTYVSDFVVTNPVSTDKKGQGDDHIRNMKAALQATFPGASKAFYFPTTALKTADFTVVALDMHKTFLVDTTTGTVTATLPTLASGDAGWECSFIKTNTGTDALFIAPSSGTIQSGDLTGLAKTRRCIPGAKSRVFWTGTAWIAERVVGAPVGAVIDYDSATLPVGYELPNGQVLAGASGSIYPDFYARKSSLVTADITGRAVAMLEAAAARLTTAVSGVDGATLRAAGGNESKVLVQANLPNVTLTTTIASGQGSHLHSLPYIFNVNQNYGADSANQATASGSTNTALATLPAMTGTTPTGGSNTGLAVVQPTIVLNKILVVE